MKQITFEDIKNTIGKLADGSDDKYFSELERLNYEQPAVVEFLLNRDELNDDEMDVLQHTAQVLWYIVKKTLKLKKEISEDYLYEQFDRNYVTYIDNIILHDETGDFAEENLSVLEELYKPNNQPVLVDYLTGIIAESADNPDSPVRETVGPSMILDIKTVIDCLVIDEDLALAEVCDKDWFDDSYETVKSSVKKYYEEFRKTAAFMRLGHNDKKEAEFIITSFSEMMYKYYLMQPYHWNARRSVECVVEWMPAKVMADDSFFEAIEPVLTAFMLFCFEKGYVPEGKAIARRLQGIAARIMEEAGDEDNWSMGKSVLKEAENRGYNLTKKDDIDAFLKSYNKDKEKMFLQQGKVNAEKPGRNDPCPCGSGKKYKKCCGADL